MTSSRSAPAAIAAGLLLVLAVSAVALGSRSEATASSAAPAVHHRDSHARRPLGEADGAVPDGTTVFDDRVPGVARLDPALLRALRRAAADAADAQGLTFVVNSGWRSAAYEDALRREAIARYGSVEQAARWVATGATSPHVSGDAVDLGPPAAAAWLAAHGAAYGLCRVYGNEPWHYELRPQAVGHGCPPTYADPTHDPRMQG
jgi:hypothetical protein